MAAIPPDLAERLARECRNAASSLIRLQDTLGSTLPELAISSRLVEDLQALDTVAQTIDDLGAIFGAILASDAATPCAGRQTDVLLARISQTSLRRRLEGPVETDAEGAVDLF